MGTMFESKTKITVKGRNLADQLPEGARKLLPHVHVNMPWSHLDQYLELVLALGMNLEIGLDAVQLGKNTLRDYENISRKLHDRGCRISLHGPFWDLNPGSVDPLIREVSRSRLNQFVDVFQTFQPVQAVCHTGFDPRHHHGQQDFWLSESLKVWEVLVKRAEGLQVPLLLENVWEHDPRLHRILLDELPSAHFGFCFDVGHQHCFSRSSVDQWLEPLLVRTQELHLHDNDGFHDLHLPIGEGSIDFHNLFDTIKKNSLKPLLTLEPHTREHLFRTFEGLWNILGNDLPAFYDISV